MLITVARIGTTINTSQDAVDLMRAVHLAMNLADRSKECLWVILLDARNRVRAIDLVYLGSACGMPVRASEIYRVAVSSGAARMILVHNHPGGSTDPSPEDIVMTRRMRRAGKLLGVPLLDSLIITEEGGFHSIVADILC